MAETTLELTIRSLGGGLQILGFLIAAAGITAARRRWNPSMPGILGNVGRLVDSIFRRHERGPASGVAASVLGRAGMTGSATVSVKIARSLEQRVEALEARAGVQAAEQASLRRDLRQEVGDRKAGDDAERAARQRDDKSLDEQLVELATGDLRQEAWGVALFLLGIILATWSSELAWVLS